MDETANNVNSVYRELMTELGRSSVQYLIRLSARPAQTQQTGPDVKPVDCNQFSARFRNDKGHIIVKSDSDQQGYALLNAVCALARLIESRNEPMLNQSNKTEPENETAGYISPHSKIPIMSKTQEEKVIENKDKIMDFSKKTTTIYKGKLKSTRSKCQLEIADRVNIETSKNQNEVRLGAGGAKYSIDMSNKKRRTQNRQRNNSEDKKPDDKNLDDKNLDDKNPDDKNPDDKNPDDKNPDDKNIDDKNPDDKNLDDKAQDNKLSDDNMSDKKQKRKSRRKSDKKAAEEKKKRKSSKKEEISETKETETKDAPDCSVNADCSNDCDRVNHMLREMAQLQIQIKCQTIDHEDVQTIETSIQHLCTALNRMKYSCQAYTKPSQDTEQEESQQSAASTTADTNSQTEYATTPIIKTSSICMDCQRNGNKGLYNCYLRGIISSMVGSRRVRDIVLTVLLQTDDIYHINVREIKSGKSLGCLFATESAIKEAEEMNVFKDFMTFFVMDSCDSKKMTSPGVGHAFEVVRDKNNREQAGGNHECTSKSNIISLEPKAVSSSDNEKSSFVSLIQVNSSRILGREEEDYFRNELEERYILFHSNCSKNYTLTSSSECTKRC